MSGLINKTSLDSCVRLSFTKTLHHPWTYWSMPHPSLCAYAIYFYLRFFRFKYCNGICFWKLNSHFINILMVLSKECQQKASSWKTDQRCLSVGRCGFDLCNCSVSFHFDLPEATINLAFCFQFFSAPKLDGQKVMDTDTVNYLRIRHTRAGKTPEFPTFG